MASNEGYTQRRRELAQIAGNLFMKQGYDSTTLGDIADAAGIDRATFYYYFKSKSELVRSAISDAVGAGMADVERARKSTVPARERVGSALRSLMSSFVAAYPWGVIYTHDDIWRSREADASWVKTIRANEATLHDTILEMVTDGQEDGSIRSDLAPEVITRTLLGTVLWGCRQLRAGGGDELADLSGAVDAILFDGLVPRSGTKARGAAKVGKRSTA